MPYIDLRIHPAPNDEQAAALARGVTDIMANVAGKRRDVTAVRIGAGEAALWTIGGVTCATTTAYVDVKITAGTNSREEKAALVQHLHRALRGTFGKLVEASYVVVHELPPENWGYEGLTQAARAAGRA
ncbi:MAG: tautomerase family protein [Gammaproteobacteria bacterium]